jgi:hypothetical protein
MCAKYGIYFLDDFVVVNEAHVFSKLSQLKSLLANEYQAVAFLICEVYTIFDSGNQPENG